MVGSSPTMTSEAFESAQNEERNGAPGSNQQTYGTG
jgi:hypothetical protein